MKIWNLIWKTTDLSNCTLLDLALMWPLQKGLELPYDWLFVQRSDCEYWKPYWFELDVEVSFRLHRHPKNEIILDGVSKKICLPRPF